MITRLQRLGTLYLALTAALTFVYGLHELRAFVTTSFHYVMPKYAATPSERTYMTRLEKRTRAGTPDTKANNRRQGADDASAAGDPETAARGHSSSKPNGTVQTHGDSKSTRKTARSYENKLTNIQRKVREAQLPLMVEHGASMVILLAVALLHMAALGRNREHNKQEGDV